MISKMFLMYKIEGGGGGGGNIFERLENIAFGGC